MSNRTMVARVVTASTWGLLALAACGGGAKQAESPGTCPDGTVLSGESCVPDSAAAAKSDGEPRAGADTDSPKGSPKASGGSPAAEGTSHDSAGGGSSYDKEAVEAQLRRAAKQVRANCGAATDEDGAKTGPWGSTTATIVLGRNGHVREVTVPAPYSGKPVGDCVVNSFKKILYPPYNAAGDASLTWEIEILQPKQK